MKCSGATLSRHQITGVCDYNHFLDPESNVASAHCLRTLVRILGEEASRALNDPSALGQGFQRLPDNCTKHPIPVRSFHGVTRI